MAVKTFEEYLAESEKVETSGLHVRGKDREPGRSSPYPRRDQRHRRDL